MRITSLLPFLLILFQPAVAQVDTWQAIADQPIGGRQLAVAFFVNGKGYSGLGVDSSGIYYRDIWSYDPVNDQWTQVADFAGSARKSAVAYALDGKGYVVSGQDTGGLRNDCWSYDPAANSWTSEQNLGLFSTNGAVGRSDATAIQTDSLAFILCGYDGGSSWLKQNWQMNPRHDTIWTLKRNLANVTESTLFGRRWGAGFSIDNKVYYGCGFSFSQDYRADVWSYNYLIDAWTQVADFGGGGRSNLCGFSLYDKGYFVGGTNGTTQSDMWRYDPNLNNWTAVADFGGGPVSNAVIFTDNRKAYMGLGRDSAGNSLNRWFVYTPDSTVGISSLVDPVRMNVYPQPATGGVTISGAFQRSSTSRIELLDQHGKIVISEPIGQWPLMVHTGSLPAGLYFYRILDGNTFRASGKLVLGR
jgi:N-acetylneuraminic acid mutarotase